MTLEEAQALIEKAVQEVRNAGFSVWGWDDGAIIIAEKDPVYRERFVEPAS